MTEQVLVNQAFNQPGGVKSPDSLRRSTPWRLARRMALGLAIVTAILVCCYAWLANSYWSKSPVPHRNYAAEINQAMIQGPDVERAWPKYRQVFVQLGDPPKKWSDFDYFPTGPRWGEVRAMLESRKGALATARDVAKKETLGFEMRDRIAPEDFVVFGEQSVRNPSDNPVLLSVFLAANERLHWLAKLLRADAYLALDEGDAARAAADIAAMIDVSRHLRQPPFLVVQKLSSEVLSNACLTWAEFTSGRSASFSDADLLRVERALTQVDNQRFAVDMSTERLSIEDAIQRFYTDDGQGDGFLFVTSSEADPGLWARLLAPLVPPKAATRREITQRYQAMMGFMEKDLSRSLWEVHDWPWVRELRQSSEDDRFRVVDRLIPDPIGVYFETEKSRQFRDAMLLATALIRHRRVASDWPNFLEEIEPAFPELTLIDRFTGAPLRYLKIESWVALYSVGLDRDEDRRPHEFAAYQRAEFEAAWKSMTVGGDSDVPDGDWILWVSGEFAEPEPELQSP